MHPRYPRYPHPKESYGERFLLAYLQAKDSLHGDEEGRNVEGLKENLCSLLPVLAGVEGGFGEQHRMLWRKGRITCISRRRSVRRVTLGSAKGAAHLLGESLQLLFGVNILPDPLHVVPVLHYTMLHRVPHRQQAPVLLDATEVVKSRQDKLERCKVIMDTKKIHLCLPPYKQNALD